MFIECRLFKIQFMQKPLVQVKNYFLAVSCVECKSVVLLTSSMNVYLARIHCGSIKKFLLLDLSQSASLVINLLMRREITL